MTSHITVRAVSSGMTSSSSMGGIRQISTPSISALRPRRSASDTACFRFTAPLPVVGRRSSYAALSRDRAPWVRCGGTGRSAGRPACGTRPNHHTHPGGIPCSASSPWRSPRRSCSSSACAGESDGDGVEVQTGAAAVAALRGAPDAAVRGRHGRLRDGDDDDGPARSRARTRWSSPLRASFDADAQQMAMEMDLGAMFEGLAEATGEAVPPEIDEPVRFVADGTTVYLRIPILDALTGSSGWLSMSTDDLGESAGSLGLGAGAFDPSKMLEVLRGTTDDVGARRAGGRARRRHHQVHRHREPGRRAGVRAGRPAEGARGAARPARLRATPTSRSRSGWTPTGCRGGSH